MHDDIGDDNRTYIMSFVEAHWLDFQIRDGMEPISGSKSKGLRGKSRNTDEPAMRAFIVTCKDSALLHSLSAMIYTGPSSLETKEFTGLLINTGCYRESTVCLRQYRAYCMYNGTGMKMDKTLRVRCNFGVGSAESIDVARIYFPFGTAWIEIDIHIVDYTPPHLPLPLLLSLADIVRL